MQKKDLKMNGDNSKLKMFGGEKGSVCVVSVDRRLLGHNLEFYL